MILSDNETKVDLLNNSAISNTVVSLIKESGNQPISIGIHGDWGAGKSSVLEMIVDQFENDEKKEKYICIRFNGWKHQGFEDSKIALMSAIASELSDNQRITAKGKEIIKKLWKNINWMSVAKTAGKTALGLATGTAPITILSSALDILKSRGTTEEGVTSVIESIDEYLEQSKITEDTSSNTEFKEFRENFSQLLEEAKIDKLIVLIDDLDRCLPDVAIDTLEAIRLFMFNEKTAFVIAADEFMIRYAVKKHFPDVIYEEGNAGFEFANRYLEKLIQVPFRIPALGAVEACNYIMLLMIGSKLNSDNENYKTLCNEGIERLKKPWDVKPFTVTDVKQLLKNDYDIVQSEALTAVQIYHILSENTNGNPRKIKRFINMLLLRETIANNRGFGASINISILAKMMLAEYYYPNFYKELPNHLNSSGVWEDFSRINIETNDEEKQASDKSIYWFDVRLLSKWLSTEPILNDIDLRPYYYACKERIDFFAGRKDENDLNEIIDYLFKDDMIIAQHVSELKALSDIESERVFEIISQKIMENGKFESIPKGINGLKQLVECKPNLQERFAIFISGIPYKDVGLWITSGFDRLFPNGSKSHRVYKDYKDKLQENGTDIVKKTLTTMKG